MGRGHRPVHFHCRFFRFSGYAGGSPGYTTVRMENCEHESFPQTHWSLVRVASAGNEEARRNALGTLLSRYEPALKSYLCAARRMNTAEAEDLLQSFFADKVLERDLFRHADESRGRFRTFLLKSLDHYRIDRSRRENRRESAEAQFCRAAAEGVETESASLAPPVLAEAAWARTLIQHALGNMHRECQQTHRMDVWAAFQDRIIVPLYENAAPSSYESLAARLGLASPTHAANLLVTAKRMYARLLRQAIAEYECDEPCIDAEIAALRAALSRTRGTEEQAHVA